MKKLIALAVGLALGSFALTGCADRGEPFEGKSHTPDSQLPEIKLDGQ